MTFVVVENAWGKNDCRKAVSREIAAYSKNLPGTSLWWLQLRPTCNSRLHLLLRDEGSPAFFRRPYTCLRDAVDEIAI